MLLLDICCNFSVYLLVGIVLNGRAYAKYTEFGCTFENDQYELRAPKPIWNKKPIETWTCGKEYSSWISLKTDLKKIFEEVMEGSILNDVDQFIEFFQAYQNQKNKQDLKSFFGDYTVPFRPKTDSAGMVIEVFRQLKRKQPSVANHLYLITAYVNPNISIDNVIQTLWLWRGGVKKLTESWFQEHVAGIIKVGLENKTGYFLLDPLYSSGSPIILLEESNKNPDILLRENRDTNNFEFTWKSLKNPFIVAEKKGTGSPGVKHIVYYLERQYCSFMDSTTKGALLLPEHKIEKRTAKGESVAYLKFKVYDAQVNKEKRYFTVGVYDSLVTGGFEEQSVTFEDVQQGHISQHARKIIEKISVHLNIKEEVIISKIVTLQTVLFQHDVLLNEMFELQNDMNDKASLQEVKLQTKTGIRQTFFRRFFSCV
uniref:Uncharacterized protein n=1 Tax=Cacopsylla melanoneura TaxID=428564 RepID=A0A8D8X009_9HEMI